MEHYPLARESLFFTYQKTLFN